MIKSISNTSLQEINLHEKLLVKNTNINNETNQNKNEKIKMCVKYIIIVVGISFLVGYSIFIFISYNK